MGLQECKEDSRALQVADQLMHCECCGQMPQVLPVANEQLHMLAPVTRPMLLGGLDLRHASGSFASCRSSSGELENEHLSHT